MNMFRRAAFLILAIGLVSAAATVNAKSQTPARKGKAPVIIIPGLTGSDLINNRTGELVWFRKSRVKDDDIRLPISANIARSRDELVTRDVLRSVKLLKLLPETEIYERLINTLETRGGYREAKWTTATRRDVEDTFFVFPYDWRRDNVENGRLLIRRIEMLKRRLGRPDLKFNVVAHSMGGLVARYGAMYGDSELPSTRPRPSWVGGRHFDKIFLLGTPNEGSVIALDAFLNGFAYVGGGLNLPFIQNINRFDIFTLPSVYQLLPHSGALQAYGEDLKPISIDIYDPAMWEKYDWAIWKDTAFAKRLSAAEQKNAKLFFSAALQRAKNFHAALNAGSPAPPVRFYLFGADCKETPAGVLLVQDPKTERWETRFKPAGFTRPNGEKLRDTDLKPLLVALGDSVVTKRSLEAISKRAGIPLEGELYQCVGHSKLVSSPEVQDKLLTFLNAVTSPGATAASK